MSAACTDSPQRVCAGAFVGNFIPKPLTRDAVYRPCKRDSIGVTYPLALKNVSMLNKKSITLVETFTAECAATGGVAPYQYEVKY